MNIKFKICNICIITNIIVLFLNLFLNLSAYGITTYEISYEYDKLNRLSSVSYDNKYILSYSYDKTGNLIHTESQIQLLLSDVILLLQFLTGIDHTYYQNIVDMNGDSILGIEEALIALKNIATSK